VKIKNLKKVGKFITTAQKYLPDGITSKAISKATGGSVLPSIPILTTDADVISFINDYGLDKPKYLIRFLIEVYCENYEALQSSIAQLKDLDMINTISKVGGAKKTYTMSKGVSDCERRLSQISSAQMNLNEATAQLEEKILYYVRCQRDFDEMNIFKQMIRYKEIDTNNALAKQGIRALLAAVTLQTVIADEMGDDIQESVISPYNDFKRVLLDSDNCLLMDGYDKEYTDEFWLNVATLLDSVNTASEITQELEEDDDTDYENIDF